MIRCTQYNKGECKLVTKATGRSVRVPGQEHVCRQCMTEGVNGIAPDGHHTPCVIDMIASAPAVPAALPTVQYNSGIGTEVERLLKADGFSESSGCSCASLRRELDSIAPDVVEARIETYARKLIDNYSKAGGWEAYSKRITLKAAVRQAATAVAGMARGQSPAMAVACDYLRRACAKGREVNTVATTKTDLSPKLHGVAVVVPCGPGYHRWLAECLQSIKSQTLPAEEILVVADRCPEAADVVSAFSGVRLLQIDMGSAWAARRAGYEATTAPLLAFIDADDTINPDYLEAACVKLADHPDAAICHSDYSRFGDGKEWVQAFPDRVVASQLWRTNSIHAGSVVRRSALRLVNAFSREPNPLSHEDWVAWRRVLSAGSYSVKSSALYNYRIRRDSRSRQRPVGTPWATTFGIECETVPVLVPLSGRAWAWPRFREWLDRQTWPHEQVELRLLDTSQNPAFSRMVRDWIATSDYPHIWYKQAAVAEPGLADRPRVGDTETQQAIDAVMLRIWRLLTEGINTTFAVTVEDDIGPPLDAIERMLRTFSFDTDIVALPYRHRFHTDGRLIPPRPANSGDVGSSPWCAFGCTAWHTDWLLKMWRPGTERWYDHAATTGAKILVRWDSEVDHWDANT